MSAFETQSVRVIRDNIYTLLQRGADGDTPDNISRDLAILAVRLDCIDRPDVKPLLAICDELRKAITDVGEQPSAFAAFCQTTRDNMLNEEADNDFTEAMRDDLRDKLVSTRRQQQREMNSLITEYRRSFGTDEWLRTFLSSDSED